MATLVDKGPVDSAVFTSAGLGNGSGYLYVGDRTTAFTGTGGGSLVLRSSNYADSFGYSNTSMTVTTTIFASDAKTGASATINPTVSPFLFYFNTQGSGGSGTGSDPAASVFTNGTKTPASASQVDLAIYQSGNTYAFFFDDGGPSGCSNNVTLFGNCILSGVPNDDNDYNDLVVTYTPRATTVPEPMSLALLGVGLIGAGMVRRTRSRT